MTCVLPRYPEILSSPCPLWRITPSRVSSSGSDVPIAACRTSRLRILHHLYGFMQIQTSTLPILVEMLDKDGYLMRVHDHINWNVPYCVIIVLWLFECDSQRHRGQWTMGMSTICIPGGRKFHLMNHHIMGAHTLIYLPGIELRPYFEDTFCLGNWSVQWVAYSYDLLVLILDV